jgi:anaphase-promoting complex subunit 11
MAASPQHALDVTIESVHLVGRWTWDIKGEDTCGICRLLFDAACPHCKAPGEDCPIVTGKCTHSFHIHCIEKWTERDREAPLCPMCRGAWDFA